MKAKLAQFSTANPDTTRLRQQSHRRSFCYQQAAVPPERAGNGNETADDAMTRTITRTGCPGFIAEQKERISRARTREPLPAGVSSGDASPSTRR
jgi:hypothetical protein